MAYSELIKNFAHIRDYMRQFFIYGFKSREDYKQKSPRSYDNERRRAESWLGEYMTFRQDPSGKAVFMSVDSRRIPCNPLYQAWKAASFTKNDISLHFLLLDILSADTTEAKTIPEILEIIDTGYLPAFAGAEPLEESTLRKKLKEYRTLGLITTQKKGRQLAYHLPADAVNLNMWRDAIAFFSEDNALGVIGSYLLDKFEHTQSQSGNTFSFKHRYLLFALDSGIVLDLLEAIHTQRKVELLLFLQQGARPRPDFCSVTLPLKIFVSTQSGRQYLAGCNLRTQKIHFFRLDSIQSVKLLGKIPDYPAYQKYLRDERDKFWGVATGRGPTEHIEMILRIAPEDTHIAHRLAREKRCGHVEQLNKTTWRFWADVYNTQELLPWLRTFIGRIVSLECSNKQVEELFWQDFAEMARLYDG